MKRYAIHCLWLSGLFAGVGLAKDPASFPSPTAVLSTCQPPNGSLLCEDLQEFVTAMNAESRDEAWAAAMESRIRKLMLLDGKPFAQLRSVQCRRTRCAVVYRVPAEEDAYRMDGDAGFDEIMDLRTGGFSREAEGAEGKTHVIGMIAWQKREEAPKLKPEPARPGKF